MPDQALVLGLLHPMAHVGLDVIHVSLPVDAMVIVDVDGLDLQPFQAVLQVLPPDLLILVFVVLGGEDDPVAPALQRLADGPLAVLVAVTHRRIVSSQ